MKITIREDRIYGRILAYPACENAKLFAKLLGVKTFNDFQLATIKAIGFQIEYKNKIEGDRYEISK